VWGIEYAVSPTASGGGLPAMSASRRLARIGRDRQLLRNRSADLSLPQHYNDRIAIFKKSGTSTSGAYEATSRQPVPIEHVGPKAEYTMTHEERLNMIKAAIKQLANDDSVPQRQTLRELKDIRSHIGSAIDTLNGRMMGDRTMAERDELSRIMHHL
jgi:hypothetical protein